MVEVILAQDDDRQRWENYVARRLPGTHAFSWYWRNIIRRSFKHTPYYLIAQKSQPSTEGERTRRTVCGILPLFHVRGMLFGSALISIPYLNAGGVLADDEQTWEAIAAYTDDLAKKLDVSYFELRHRQPCPFQGGRLTERTHKVSMQLALAHNAEETFSRFRPKLRSQIRRPAKSGIIAEVSPDTHTGKRDLNAFYRVFSEHMRDLGTPVFPRRLFRQTVRHFGDAARIVTVWQSSRPIAAAITLKFGDVVEIPWASSLRRFNKEAPNMLLYWEAIKTACNDGATVFDFGRSTIDSGPHRFKEQWGAAPVQLHWYYKVYRGDIPHIDPANPKFARLVSCWKKLPLPVTNTLGPWITRSLP